MTEDTVRLRGVSHRFGSHEALRQIDVTIRAGERVGILGASGAGKSTLLALLNGSISPSEGTVEVLSSDLAGLSAGALRAVRRRIGTLRQDLALVEQVRVLHNVNAGRLGEWSTLRALGSLAFPRATDDVRAALARVDLGWALHERTERLSGGERQRVAIARLLVQAPELILADEPVSSLDPVRAKAVLDLLADVPGVRTVVVSLHQPDLARVHCSRVIGLQRGRVVLDRPAASLTETDLELVYEMA